MKKIFSKNNIFTLAWFFFHFVIVAVFLLTLKIYGGFTFDADYTTMMPSSNESPAAKIAEKSIGENSGNNVFILAGNEDFSKAKKAAESAYEALKDNSKFRSLTLYADMSTMTDLQDFISKWKYNLISEKSRKSISEDSAAFAENAIASSFSFTLSEIDPENDPFLLTNESLKDYMAAVGDSGAALSPKDGVLASQFQEKWYVMIRGELTREGAKLASKSNGVPDIYAACLPLESDGTRFVFYGTPFHSFKSSSSATREISIISTVTIIVIVIMLFIVFRSFLPLFASVVSIMVSVGAAFLMTHAIFGNIHMIAIIFGTSLIGSCIDYSLHYFINWKGSPELKTGDEIRRHLINGLFLSLVSTEICYLMLMFAPFTMLKQISVFSFTGILSSFLTTAGIFPLLKLPAEEKRRIPILDKIFKNGVDSPEDESHRRKRKFAGKIVITAIFVISIGSILICKDKLRIENNVQNLYKMEGRLKEDTITAYQVIKYSPTSWLIISGKSAEEVLQKEESLIPLIPDPFVATARFIPSAKSQKESYEAAGKNLLPMAEEQLRAMLYPADLDEEDAVLSPEEELELKGIVEKFKVDYQNQNGKIIRPEDGEEIPETLKSVLKMLWIGNVDGTWYSIILPSQISDEKFYIDLASTDDNIHYENKIKDVSKGLDHLTRMIVVMFLIAFVVISILIKFFYNFRDTFKIVTIPLVSILTISATFVVSDLPIEFFCITGVILVFGLGLDYVIYKRQNKGNKLEGFAITLSFLTTAISFGALALSSFVPVHVLGISIFSGLVAAFVCTML